MKELENIYSLTQDFLCVADKFIADYKEKEKTMLTITQLDIKRFYENENKTFQQIGEILNMSRETVRKQYADLKRKERQAIRG